MKHLQFSFVNLRFLRLQNMSMFSVACLLLLVQPLDAGKSPSCGDPGHCKPKPPTLLQIRANEVGSADPRYTIPWDEGYVGSLPTKSKYLRCFQVGLGGPGSLGPWFLYRQKQLQMSGKLYHRWMVWGMGRFALSSDLLEMYNYVISDEFDHRCYPNCCYAKSDQAN